MPPRKLPPRKLSTTRKNSHGVFPPKDCTPEDSPPPLTNLPLEENHMGNSPPEDQLLTNLQLEDCQQKIAPRDDWEHNSVDSMAQITFI